MCETIKKESFLDFYHAVEIAADSDSFVDKIKHRIKDYYYKNGSLSIKYLYHLSRVLSETEHAHLLRDVRVNLDDERQRDALCELSSYQFDLISFALTEDEIYLYFLLKQKKTT